MKNAGLVLAMLLAGIAMTANGEDPGKTTEWVSEAQSVAGGGQWNYAVRRGDAPWDCGPNGVEQKCVEQDVMIRNDSDRTLECRLHVDYKAPDGRVLISFDTPALVYPRSRLNAHRHIIDPAAKAEVTRLGCLDRAPYPRLPKVEGCTYEMKGPLLEEYYPPNAVRLSLEGPVTVAFTLTEASGKASGAVVAESSLVPELDAAALRFIADQRFKTPCPATRFDVRIRFRLRTQVATGRG